jgi:hypothetical protein
VSRYFEPSWDPEYVFYGKSTWFIRFNIGDFCVGALLHPWPQEPFYGSGKLCIIEFEVLQVPPIGETYSSILNIDNDETFLLDPDINDIPAVKENGYYDISWLIYPHDVAIILDAPDIVPYGSSNTVKVTVLNRGKNNETNVELYLFINNTVVKFELIPQIHVGEIHIITYTWTSMSYATYNFTAYVQPVPR